VHSQVFLECSTYNKAGSYAAYLPDFLHIVQDGRRHHARHVYQVLEEADVSDEMFTQFLWCVAVLWEATSVALSNIIWMKLDREIFCTTFQVRNGSTSPMAAPPVREEVLGSVGVQRTCVTSTYLMLKVLRKAECHFLSEGF
jgi:hypothetical protein